MTKIEAVKKLVATALAEVGYSEGSNNFNRYAPSMTTAYGWNVQNQPWCDVFVDWCFVAAFGLQQAAALTYQKVGSFSALCSASAAYYKDAGAWFASPEPGDQVFFNASGAINHTGIVVAVNGSTVTCVEGNSSDAVRKNVYTVGSSYINGYGRPNWPAVAEQTTADNSEAGETGPASGEGQAAVASQTCTVTVKLPVIRKGDTGAGVKMMQRLLIDQGCWCGTWGADGDYGDDTAAGLLKFQQNCRLTADGVCGPLTWQKLLEVS